MAPPQVTLSFPSDLNLKPVTFETGLFINNEFVESADQSTFETINPANAQVLGVVSEAKAKDVDIAVQAAERAFNLVWGTNTPSQERGRLLYKLAEAIDNHREILAAIETIDNGKPYSMAKNIDLSKTVDTFRYFAGWADKNVGETNEVDNGKLAFTIHEPIGVVGQIIPWNFPLMMLSWKLAPALATGNTIVLKTAEQTPLSALYVCKLIKDIFPAGVVNILSGFGPSAGSAIVDHPKIQKIAFTGSTAVGKAILARSSDKNLKRVTLELGGKSPNIIFEDADLEQAVRWAAFGLFFNQGQTCTAGSRVYVQEAIYDKFLQELQTHLKSMKIGDPFDPNTFQGPQVSQVQFDRIMGYIQSGKTEGAECLLGGNRLGQKGYFIEPTIFTNAHSNMKIFKEEIFGPVVIVKKFKDEDDVVAQAHNTTYGLAAAIHTRDINKALLTSKRLKAGTVWVNCYNLFAPQLAFGGYKDSGLGRENAQYALRNYTEVKSVIINLNDKI
ncbi:hypothetical protein O181_075038 [Austropuccinia psidii MF-1]|uniref:Aldehyde dehydrogenase domain-containing protein n=1 Tax=Austropuccinia psidii MF-1 TaxID=1389203 RepID=A0A9Q3F831_9BASI|nr:hypothetical protein [Austropuccinia psidii MF-1]